MDNAFDLVVIGGGPAGYVGAIRASQLGLSTALVEREKVGGTCLHVGCIPTKVLLHTAELLEEMRASSEMGIVADGVRLDYPLVHKRKDRVVTTNFRGVEYLMRKNKIAMFHGTGRLAGPTRVHVSATDGSEVDLDTKHILVATGSRPRSLPSVAIDNGRILDSTGALALPTVPKSIAILGAGAVGTEFASVFAAFGAEVTLIELLPSVLPLEDEEVAAVVAKALERRGVKVRTGTAVTGATAAGDGVTVTVRAGDGPEESIHAEYVLVAVGRVPLTDGLGLDAAGVQVGRGGIIVNAQMQTSVPTVYAAGDVIGGLLLAHVGSAEAEVAVEAIAGDHAPDDRSAADAARDVLDPAGRERGADREAGARSGARRLGGAIPVYRERARDDLGAAGRAREDRGRSRAWRDSWGAPGRSPGDGTAAGRGARAGP